MRIRYETIEFGEVDIHVRTLRDTNQVEDDDGAAEAAGVPAAFWGMFGSVWESGRVLAALMSEIDIEGRRFLEIGCGIGVASLMLNHRRADITAIDRHPSAGTFLARNVVLNGGPEIAFECLDWGREDDSLGRFDVIIGSDLLYERDQGEPLADFVVRHAASRCRIVFVDAGRGGVHRFRRRIESHGFRHDVERAVNIEVVGGHEIGPRVQVHSFCRG